MRSGVVRRARQTKAQGRGGGEGLTHAPNFKIKGPIYILGLGIKVLIMFDVHGVSPNSIPLASVHSPGVHSPGNPPLPSLSSGYIISNLRLLTRPTI